MRWFFAGWILVFFTGCNSNFTKSNPIPIPSTFDVPIYPKDNQPTTEKIELGKKLFFDTNLSRNHNISCSSCHIPEFAFSDTTKFSIGTNGELGFRNSPSIINVAYKKLFHKDGGVRTLELQALSPIIDTTEMFGDFKEILKYLSSSTSYITLFKQAFDTIPTIYGMTRSIATYERSLLFGDSSYDIYMKGDDEALSDGPIRGLKLFNSKKLNCTACHKGFLFTDFSYQNIGLEPQFTDSGRARITYLPEDAGKFEVPSLRNVAITAPYMHDGSIATLSEVISYFENGGGSHPNKSKLMKPFTLTNAERQDLISFLNTLTDERFRKN